LLDESAARRLTQLLGAHFYADPGAAADASRRCASFNVIDQRSFIKIDIFVPPTGPMGLGQLDRRQLLELLPGLRVLPTLGPEDVVLQKLRWYRTGGEVSDRQWRDLLSVLRHSAAMDHEYLDRVASSAGLADLLARARAEAADAVRPG
jgi:hypothetical protein